MMRTWFWISVTAIAFVFWVMTRRVTRRLRRARAEVRRMKMLRHAYELEQQADEIVLGVG